MKFLFRSSDALCLPQALRVKWEGHSVKLSIDRPEFNRMGDGLIDKSVNLEKDVNWADVIIYDVQDGPLYAEADKIRSQKPVLGATKLARMLEHDRKFGLDFARRSGLRVPEMREFSGALAFARAREFLRSKGPKEDWVLKVNGKAPNGVGTYVSQDGRNGALRVLEHWETLYKLDKIAPDFLISAKVEGVEISTEGWFNGREFYCFNHTIERTKFFPRDLGEKVGCTGNVVWASSLGGERLVRSCLQPAAEQLVGKFVGPFDVNCIIERETNEPTFLEYSPRFGYDAIFALMELFSNTDFGEFLYKIAKGESWEGLLEGYAGDVRITIPPFPAKGAKDDDPESVGVPIFGLDAGKYNRHCHFIEVMINEKDELVTSGPHGVVLSVTGYAGDVRSAQEEAYRIAKAIRVPNMRYRDDLTEAIGEVYDDLEATGWLSDVAQEMRSVPKMFQRMGRPSAGRGSLPRLRGSR